MRISGLFVLAAALYGASFSVAFAQRTGAFAESLNHPAILYSTTAANTVVDELNRNYHRVDGYSLKAKLAEARERAGTTPSRDR